MALPQSNMSQHYLWLTSICLLELNQVSTAYSTYSNLSTAMVFVTLYGKTECTNGEIRLVPGSDSRQYVQYCSDGEWKSMCTGAGTWQNTEAAVACRQLGYSASML